MKNKLLSRFGFIYLFLRNCTLVLSLDDVSYSVSPGETNYVDEPSLKNEVYFTDMEPSIIAQDFRISHNVTVNRELQDCAALHDGTYFNNMFFEGDHWVYDDDNNPNLASWHACNLFFGKPMTSTSFHVTNFVYLPSGSSTYKYQSYTSGSQATARFYEFEGMYPTLAAATLRVTFKLEGTSTRMTSVTPSVITVRSGNANTNAHLDNMKAFVMETAVPYNVLVITERTELQNLLDGKKGKIYGKGFENGETQARISTKHQIRIFDPYPSAYHDPYPSGYHYLNRKIINKDSSSYLLSSSFSIMHKEIGGGNNPAFGMCEKVSPNRVIPDGSQTAFCCDGQCTHDVTSSNVWLTSACDVIINDCYNTLLADCVVGKKTCEQLVADPNDDIIHYRAQLPQKNTWVFYAREEMFGGGVNSKGQRFTATGRSIIDGHHSIDYEGAGHGNGKYKVTYRLLFKPDFIASLYPDPDKKLLDLTVYSHSTQEELARMPLTVGGLREINEYSLEVTLADRHLADIAFRSIPYTNDWLKYDFARVEFLEYETLPPTPAPTSSPTPVAEWTVLYRTGSFGNFKFSESIFNDHFSRSETKIMERKCSGCVASHTNIYYKRLTNLDTFQPYQYMINAWKDQNNVLNVDFELYSTLSDALAGVNKWQYCNYWVSGTVGFPRDCGPTGPVSANWNPNMPNVEFNMHRVL